MTVNSKSPYKNSSQGFTMVEIIVTIVLFSLALLALGSLVVALQTAKRNNEYLTNAATAVRISTENIRTGFTSVTQCGFVQDLTGAYSTSNVVNARGSATLTCEDGIYGPRRLDVIIYYDVGSVTKSYQISTYTGNSGLY